MRYLCRRIRPSGAYGVANSGIEEAWIGEHPSTISSIIASDEYLTYSGWTLELWNAGKARWRPEKPSEIDRPRRKARLPEPTDME